PLTLAIVSSLLVKVHDESFILPQVNITELVNVVAQDKKSRIDLIQDQYTLKLRGKLLPLVNLGRLLDLDGYQLDLFSQDRGLQIVIIEVDGLRLGLMVDEVIGIEEIVVKPIPQYLNTVKIYSGTTILGNGEVALILDLSEISKSESKYGQFDDDLLEQERLQKEEEIHKNSISNSYLIFDNGSEENFSIPVSYIKRIDQFEAHKIQRVGSKSYMEVQGKALPLLNLENYMEIQAPNQLDPQKAKVLILDHEERFSCLLIHNIIDSKSINLDLDTSNLHSDLVEGSMLINQKLILFLDIPHLMNLSNGGQ
ncbi:chemotaxis protein CheW, partial [bacterium]|nr:chemotaxis protein CheW [bacterium]